ncbi:hypothetical protein C8J46_10659 [Sphingomonas sp. PP-F2F-A104-K0414]|uniref:hypothetical protein n=1 Tax=Sphingomonas sp. PP-F2F-A104-K0414 TaxID=2135661 RepID=UPI00104CDD71|nr:hypothetical protein [Sphingomonas sp. PP-F2F-A104-K0414]TCP97437.1 hypothetical protein C8J46_10659 [Sphingomonas sp. PP-F2F-A104-K0414]
MATEQPNIAPGEVKPEPNDADNAATVLDDAQMIETPGGGGLGGADAADVLSGSGKLSGGATPHSPIDVPVPHGGGNPTREAQLRSLNDGPKEPHTNPN